MPPSPRRLATIAALLVTALALASCGGGPKGPRMGDPKPLLPENYRAAGIPAIFGDVDPVEWDGALKPASYPVHGIDAARYQGEIDFVTARANGVSFAWLKATEGGDHLDPGWAVNAPRARAAGVPVGAYHFYYFCRTPEEQARWFIKTVDRRPGDLPPVLDMEWNHQSSCKARPDPVTVRADIQTYSAMIAAHYGTRPVIYTTPDFYEHNALGQLAGAEFWLRSVAAHPSERYPQERWTFWQYTGTGVARGVKGHVDLNAFAGSPESWAAWYSARAQR